MHDIDDALSKMETTLTMQQQQLPTGTLEATGVAAAVAEINQLRTQLNTMTREIEIVQTVEPAKTARGAGTARGGPSSRHSPRRSSGESRARGAPSRRKSSGPRPPSAYRQESESDVPLAFGAGAKSPIIPPPPPPSDPAPYAPSPRRVSITHSELPPPKPGGLFGRLGAKLGMQRDPGRQGSDIQLQTGGAGASQPAPPAPWWTDSAQGGPQPQWLGAPPPPPPDDYGYHGASYHDPHYDPYYSERDSGRLPDNLA